MGAVIAFHEVVATREGQTWGVPVSFNVEPDRFYVIRTTPGHSSALLSLCLGWLTPESGSVEVLGVEPSGLPRGRRARWRTKVGTILQPEGLVTTMTLRANIVVPLIYACHFSVSDAKLRAQEVLAATRLTNWADRRPDDLPLDVRQRAALARALAPLPSLLLLEDPLASLASTDAQRLFDLCRQWVPTVVATTHRRNPALYEVADDVMLWDVSGFRPGVA